jgi:hypothetical protein
MQMRSFIYLTALPELPQQVSVRIMGFAAQRFTQLSVTCKTNVCCIRHYITGNAELWTACKNARWTNSRAASHCSSSISTYLLLPILPLHQYVHKPTVTLSLLPAAAGTLWQPLGNPRNQGMSKANWMEVTVLTLTLCSFTTGLITDFGFSRRRV